MNNILNWPTEKSDMQTANAIIEKYLDLSEGEPLGILEITVNEKNEEVDVKPAAWVEELAEYFREKYGQEYGQDITGMVITRCLLKGETIH
jgi:hypothetical protein